MATITRDEALLVVKKWFDEKTAVRCDFSFERIVGCLRGRIFKFDGQDLGLLSPDRRSELSIRISHDATFGYGGFQGPPVEPDNVIAVVFPYSPGQKEQDYVALSEDFDAVLSGSGST